MKLYESIFILKRYEEWIVIRSAIMAGLNYHKHSMFSKEHTIHYVTLYNAVLLDVCSFLDEYDNNFLHTSEPEFKDRIISVRKICKPARDIFREWKGIDDMRNMIAHPWRDESTKEFKLTALGTLDAPKNFGDLLGMLTSIQVIMKVIANEFEEHAPNVWPYIDSIPNESTISTKMDDFETRMPALIHTINQNCMQAGKRFQLNENEIMRFAVYDLQPI